MSFSNLSLLTSKRYNILTILIQPAVALNRTNPLMALQKTYISTLYMNWLHLEQCDISIILYF